MSKDDELEKKSSLATEKSETPALKSSGSLEKSAASRKRYSTPPQIDQSIISTDFSTRATTRADLKKSQSLIAEKMQYSPKDDSGIFTSTFSRLWNAKKRKENVKKTPPTKKGPMTASDELLSRPPMAAREAPSKSVVEEPGLRRTKSASPTYKPQTMRNDDAEDFVMRPGAKKAFTDPESPEFKEAQQEEAKRLERVQKKAQQEEEKRLRREEKENREDMPSNTFANAAKVAMTVKRAFTKSLSPTLEGTLRYKLARAGSMPTPESTSPRFVVVRANSAPVVARGQTADIVSAAPETPSLQNEVRTDGKEKEIKPIEEHSQQPEGRIEAVHQNYSRKNKIPSKTEIIIAQMKAMGLANILNTITSALPSNIETESSKTRNGFFSKMVSFASKAANFLISKAAQMIDPQNPKLNAQLSQDPSAPKIVDVKGQAFEIVSSTSVNAAQEKSVAPATNTVSAKRASTQGTPPVAFDDFNPKHEDHDFAVGGHTGEPLLKSIPMPAVRYSLSKENQDDLGVNDHDIGKVEVKLTRGENNKYTATKTPISLKRDGHVQTKDNEHGHGHGH